MRKLAIAAFSFAAAVFLTLYLTGTENCLLFAGIFVVAGLLAFLLKGKARVAAMISLFSAAFGMLWLFGYYKTVYEPAEMLNGENINCIAEVRDFPTLTDYGSKVPVKLETGTGRKLKAQLYIFDNSGDNLVPGDEISVKAKASLTDRKYSTFIADGSFISAFCTGEAEKTSSGETEKLRFLHRYAARELSEIIDKVFSPEVSPFIGAMLTGDKEKLNDDYALSSSLRISGISHIVAVSGMHLAFLVGFVLSVIRHKRIASFVAIPVIVLFAAVVGFPPSIVRAAVMQILLLVAPLVYREPDSITSLSFALGLILLINPYAALSISLQLSFGATLGIVLVTIDLRDSVYDKLRGKKIMETKLTRKLVSFIVDTLCTSVGALVFTIPLSALHFGSVSLIAPLTNILTLWAVSACFMLAFIACLLGFLWMPLGTVAGYAATIFAKYVLWIARELSGISIATVSAGNIPVMTALFLIYAIILLFVFMKAKPRQLIVPGCIAAVLFCTSLVLSVSPVYSAKPEITTLNVGQGQSIVAKSKGYTAMVDCGSGGGENAGRIASSYLSGEGIDRIDVLIFTHLHEDHANGFSSLSENVDIGAIIMPPPLEGEDDLREEIIALAEYRQIDVKYVAEDIVVNLGDMKARVFAPLGYGAENENGLIVLFSQNEFDALVTGDIPQYAEDRLVSEKAIPDIELLIVGHHGSKYSTSEYLLDSLKPETAVISVGENTYGHPTPEVLERLLSRGIDVCRTDTNGNIKVTSE